MLQLRLGWSRRYFVSESGDGQIVHQDTEEFERRMREHLTAEERFLLTRLALSYCRTPEENKKLEEKRADALCKAAERMGFGDLMTQIFDWAEKQIQNSGKKR